MGCILCKDSCCLNHDNSISSEQIHRESPISSQVLPRNTILSVQQLNQNRFTLPRVTQNLQANEQEPINNLNNAQAEQGSRNEEEDNQIVNREHVEEREEEEQPEMILQRDLVPDMDNVQVYRGNLVAIPWEDDVMVPIDNNVQFVDNQFFEEHHPRIH